MLEIKCRERDKEFLEEEVRMENQQEEVETVGRWGPLTMGQKSIINQEKRQLPGETNAHVLRSKLDKTTSD